MISGRNQGRPSVFLSNMCVGLCVLKHSAICNMMMGVCTFCWNNQSTLLACSVLLNVPKHIHYLTRHWSEKSCDVTLGPDSFMWKCKIFYNKQDTMPAVTLPFWFQFPVTRKVAQHSHIKRRDKYLTFTMMKGQSVLHWVVRKRKLLRRHGNPSHLQCRKSSLWPLSCPWKIWWVMLPVLLRAHTNKTVQFIWLGQWARTVFVSNSFIYLWNFYQQVCTDSGNKCSVPAKLKKKRIII